MHYLFVHTLVLWPGTSVCNNSRTYITLIVKLIRSTIAGSLFERAPASSDSLVEERDQREPSPGRGADAHPAGDLDPVDPLRRLLPLPAGRQDGVAGRPDHPPMPAGRRRGREDRRQVLCRLPRGEVAGQARGGQRGRRGHDLQEDEAPVELAMNHAHIDC